MTSQINRRQAVALLGAVPFVGLGAGEAAAKAPSAAGAIDAWDLGVRTDARDVTEALQAAVDRAAAEGRSVFVRATRKGEGYRMRGTLRLPARVSLLSSAPEAAEFRIRARTAIEITGPRCTIYGIRLLAPRGRRQATAFRLATGTGAKLELIHIHGCGARRFSFGIRDDEKSRFRMDTLHFERNSFQAMGEGGVGIYLRHIAGSVYIRDNMVSFLRSAKTGTGYYIRRGGGVKFSSHAIGNFDEGAGEKNMGAYFDRCAALWLDGCNIENFGGKGIVLNRCYVVRGAGVHAGANNGTAITIDNCIAVDLKTTTIRGNNASEGAQRRAIGLHVAGKSSEVRVDGLRINETTGDAVRIESEVDDVVASGLFISGRRSKARIGGHGLVSSGTNVFVHGAHIRDADGVGLVAGGQFQADQLTVTDCAKGRIKLTSKRASVSNWAGDDATRRTVTGPRSIP